MRAFGTLTWQCSAQISMGLADNAVTDAWPSDCKWTKNAMLEVKNCLASTETTSLYLSCACDLAIASLEGIFGLRLASAPKRIRSASKVCSAGAHTVLAGVL